MTKSRDIADSINRIDSSAADATAMTIDANENVGIGTSSPACGLHVDNPDNGAITAILDTDNSAVKMVFRNNTETGNNVQIGADGSNLVALTGATERMRIDSSGRVTMPYQPSFHAIMPGSPSTYDAANDTGVISDNFTSTFHNIGSHYNTSNGRFTAPVAGRYFFSGNVRWETESFVQNSYIRLFISKNGGTFQSTELNQICGSNEAWNNYMNMTISGVLDLAANDYVQLNGGLNGGTAKLHREGSFTGHFLG